MNNLVSIIMPVFNTEKYLGQAIDSVLNQSYNNWELLIIDDCSPDLSYKIAKKYAMNDSRIRLFHLKKNKGVAFARNLGLRYSGGEFICFLDSDDLWQPHKLSHQIAILEKNNDIDILSGSYIIVNENNTKTLNQVIVPHIANYSYLLYSNSVPCLTAIGKTSVLKKNKFPKIGYEDYAFWLDLTKNGRIVKGDCEVIAKYRSRSDSFSGNKFKALLVQWNIYKNYLNFSWAKSVYFMFFYIIKGIIKHYF